MKTLGLARALLCRAGWTGKIIWPDYDSRFFGPDGTPDWSHPIQKIDGKWVNIGNLPTDEEESIDYPVFDNYPVVEKPKRRSRHIKNDVQAEAMRRAEGRCEKCGSGSDLQYDHIIPFSEGGGSQIDNIQVLCKDCNLRKSNKIGYYY